MIIRRPSRIVTLVAGALTAAVLVAPGVGAESFEANSARGAEGKILAIWTDESEASCTNLTLSDPDGTPATERFLDWGCNDAAYGWTPDGRNIIGSNRGRSIYMREPFGHVVRRIPMPDGEYIGRPDPVSPDGQHAFVLNTSFWWPPEDTGNVDLQIVDLATGRVRSHVFPRVRYLRWGQWSPDGSRLYLLSLTKERARDYVYDIERRRLRELSGQGVWGRAGFKDFAPDGKRGLFLRQTEEWAEPMMIIANLDGSNVTRLVRGTGDWSPRGDLIAFTREQDTGVDAIYVIPPAGGNARRIATPFGGVLDMVWSPEGDRIAYATPHPDPDKDWLFEIHVVDVDGSDDHIVGDDFAGLGWGELEWQSLCTIKATGATPIQGTPRADKICGSADADVVRAGEGADLVFGARGADALYGGPGRDLIVDAAGGSRLSGGPGQDRLVSFRGRSRLSGGDGNDRLNARDGSGGDVLFGGPGRDVCLGDPNDIFRSC